MLIKLKEIEISGNVLIVAIGLVFFTFVLIFVEWKFESDAQVFQVIATIVGGFSSSLFTLLKTNDNHAAQAPPTAAPPPTVTPVPPPPITPAPTVP